MAFHDDVRREVLGGRAPFRFRVADLLKVPCGKEAYRIGDSDYKLNSIKSIPRNHSTRPDGSAPGDYVRKGRSAAFYWYGNGEFELIVDRPYGLEEPIEEATTLTEEGDSEALFGDVDEPSSGGAINSIDRPLVREIAVACGHSPAATIVRYLAKGPFRLYHRRQLRSVAFPGWHGRLMAYYWPSPENGWKFTSQQLAGLTHRLKSVTARLAHNRSDSEPAEELLHVFKEICLWGGVRLPESNPHTLAEEFMCTFQALAKGSVPKLGRLNSAWTKLYALSRPEDCVIYDSRVAAALTSILDPIMSIVSTSLEWRSYAALGTVPGRGGSRPRHLEWKWPVGYRSWEAQIAANRLCRAICDELNRESNTRAECRKENGSPWSLREVEAVLFMEGY